MAYVVHLCTLLLVGSIVAEQGIQRLKRLKYRTIREQARFKRLFFSKPGVTYTVEVTTGTQEKAGTDADVFIIIQGSKGTSSKKKLSGSIFENNFEKGRTDTFKVELSADLGAIKKITIIYDSSGIWNLNSKNFEWNLDRIKITAPDGKQYIFKCNCFLDKKSTQSKDLFPEGKILGGCDGIFADAAHCWPFNDATFNVSPDLKGGFPATLEDGARIADSVARGKVASTLEQGSWINMGNLKGKCISDPSLCVNGITMMFWARIEASDVLKNPSVPKEVLSSGGIDSRSKGFSFFHKDNQSWEIRVANEGLQTVLIPAKNIPLDSWFSLAFTWDKASAALKYYINGKGSLARSQAYDAHVPHVNQFNDLTISKPNSNNKKEEMLPMKFDQFVTWGRVLQPREIDQAFKEGGGVPASEGAGTNYQACQPNPCKNGGVCKIDVDEPRSYRCVCPLQYAGLNCEIQEEEPVRAAPTTAVPTTAVGSTAAGPTAAGPTSAPGTKPTTPAATTAARPTAVASTAAASTAAASTAAASTAAASTAAASTAAASTAAASTAAATTAAATTAAASTVAATTAAATAATATAVAATTAAATTVAASTGGPSTGAASTAPATPTGGPTSPAGSTAAATTAQPPTTAGGATTSAVSTVTPTTGGLTSATETPLPDIKQLIRDLISEINLFRRLHQSSDVTPSENLNQLASQWAKKIAAEGVEKIDPNSTYGQLVCSHSTGGNIAKACVVKWYGAIKFFDWADPKLTIKASPFTQMVWKSNSVAGVGLAKGGGGFKRQNVGGKYYVVVLFDPGQDANANIGENVLPAAGISEPAPQATCPEGYSKLPQGSRSCFSVKSTTLTWDDALYGCALDNGTLASFQCKEEADLVLELIKASNASEAWIGLHDRSKEGRYVWVDGSTIPFSEWLQGEPNGDTSENCIVQANGNWTSGWADRRCFERKAFVCEVPVPGYTTYKLTFNLTEPKSQSYQNNQYSQSLYPGSYSMCTPYVQSSNDLLKETITRYFQAKNIAVQPIVNTIRCMPNGLSIVEVILRLGPEAGSDSITSLQTSIQMNDGELELSNGASAKLISVTILNPGVSYCPSQCAITSCQPGCDQSCCTQSTPVQYPPAMAPQPQPLYPNTGPWQCPAACSSNTNYCPPYCSVRCCKRRVNIHKF